MIRAMHHFQPSLRLARFSFYSNLFPGRSYPVKQTLTLCRIILERASKINSTSALSVDQTQSRTALFGNAVAVRDTIFGRCKQASNTQTLSELFKINQMARSKEIAPGVGRYSRSQVKAKRGLFKGPKKSSKPAAPETPAHVEKQIGGEKNGGTRLVPTSKASRFYPAEDVRVPKKSRKVSKPTKLRASITPGTVLILLAGRFSGKRVVFLKQLDSGLLLVTGPYKVNGVPLRRVNQAYVIATQTKIDLGDFKVDEKVNDAYFAKSKAKGSKSAEEEFFSEGKPKEKEALPEHRSSTQKEVDTAVIAGIKKTENLGKYLKSTFGLSNGQFPHQLVF